MFSKTLTALLAFLALAACGDLPQPFRGDPGMQGRRLAQPMALRLAVPPPQQALLSDQAAGRFADALAKALQGHEIPAVATATPLPLDWRVQVVADQDGRRVLPRFRLVDADGREQGSTNGNPVPVRDWAEPNETTLRRVSEQAADKLAGLILGVEAARKASDPATLTERGPRRLRFTGVRNAPGDGNVALARRMREFLTQQGMVVQDNADGALYALEGDVVMVPAGPLQRVEIQWVISRRDGEELGRVVQMNEVRAGSLNGLWGDVAYVVAEEAAPGVRRVIDNATAPRDPTPPKPEEAARAAEPAAEAAGRPLSTNVPAGLPRPSR